MVLFSDSMLEDLRALPGSDHSFLKQLAQPDGAPWRAWLQDSVDTVAGPAAERWHTALNSLDNPQFFQGYAEIASSMILHAQGWRLVDLSWPGPSLVFRDPSGQRFTNLVLAFMRQERQADRETIARLVRSLSRIGSRSRIVVLIRRWLPHDFNPEPVRRAIDMWLREVDRNGWDGRYAEYRDEHVSLEFALSGETARDGQDVVAMALGPFDAHRAMAAIEQRVVYELDALRLSAWSDLPVLLTLVSDLPWRLPDGYLRELFYAKPCRQETHIDGLRSSATFDQDPGACLFRDPLYRAVSAAMLLQRPADRVQPEALCSYVNPWAERAVAASSLPGRVFAVHAQGPSSTTMTWLDR
mgnify:CR=1 FL=1